MSKSFLTKLAGGVVLGSAALLIAAPATALAASDGPTKEPNNSNHEREWKRDSNDRNDQNNRNDRENRNDRDNRNGNEKDNKDNKDKKGGEGDRTDKDDKNNKNDRAKTFTLRDKNGNGVVCATNDQNVEAGVAQTISNNTISGGVNYFNQSGVASATLDVNNVRATVVCIRDIDVDVEVKEDLLNDILQTVQLAGAGVGTPLGQPTGIPALGGAYAGPNGAWVLPANGSVAAGEGGAFADSNTGSLVAAGTGMMGVAALGGFGLLRRRSVDGTVA
ncbi:hypothetical protein E1193_20350 [Micromonospora sp. KC606]|uniref:hypothetical protein n=1 Tax=Micromonospora sp. KC606 TaxID=2530379 RepID=UPI0010446831|nr:hypothetical protein [Micromonospora sp. KC606]TDC78682.1 hypothetical protein E1193_20350 [Micromonospora sp. KC606]